MYVINLNIKFKKFIRPLAAILLIAAAVVIIVRLAVEREESSFVLGGILHANFRTELDLARPVFGRKEADTDEERFQRPSKLPAMKLRYDFEDFVDTGEIPQFNTAENVIHAYYAILREAANMDGYHGGCGTIGMAKTSYPYAYELLAPQARQGMTLEEFIRSFSGIGHITLLKLYSAYHPENTDENTRYYVVEIEVITGPPVTEKNKGTPQPSYFAYYYGLVTVEKMPSEGWKIRRVDYVPEDFLCAPYHLWDWDAKALVQIVYGEWYKLIDKIERIDKDNSIISIYANGVSGKYRFDFLRLTNGEDILLHEYIIENGKLKEVNLLEDEHQIYKFSVLNPILKESYKSNINIKPVEPKYKKELAPTC